WLLRWEAGADPDDPQAELWRRVARGRAHRARRIQDYLDRHERRDGPLPAGLPPRLCAFATLNVSPDVLRVIATQARVGTLHCFVPSPVKDYWGDLQRARALPEAAWAEAGAAALLEDETPLLRAWGAAGVDFMRLVGTYEVVHASAEVHAHADPGEGGGRLHGSLLRRLQSVRYPRRRAPGWPPRTALARPDPSLRLAAAHGRGPARPQPAAARLPHPPARAAGAARPAARAVRRRPLRSAAAATRGGGAGAGHRPLPALPGRGVRGARPG